MLESPFDCHIHKKLYIYKKELENHVLTKETIKKISQNNNTEHRDKDTNTHTKGILAKFQFVSKRVIRSAVHKHRRAG